MITRIRHVLSFLLAVAALIRPWSLDRYEIIDDSMEPTLRSGEFVITRQPGRRIQRGDVVIIAGGDGRYLVKRVIGLPGETVAIVGGVIMIDDAPLDDPWWSGATRPEGTWPGRNEQFYVLGDNRNRSSNDSRTIGGIERERIISIVILRYWPLSRIGRIATAPIVASEA